MNQVLFLCTGNYYRSRFAEILFNHLAKQSGIQWSAISRGLHVQAPGVVNVGPISIFTQSALQSRRIPLPPERFPEQVTHDELAAAGITVAVKEAEHFPLMQRLHPEFARKIRYWTIHDLDAGHPAESLANLERHVRLLITECQTIPHF
ncbi:MAG TPA: low molecular weight phosphatase family protein [Phycisphaerae bacterium]|jgi:protein-tyrosine phosphatase